MSFVPVGNIHWRADRFRANVTPAEYGGPNFSVAHEMAGRGLPRHRYDWESRGGHCRSAKTPMIFFGSLEVRHRAIEFPKEVWLSDKAGLI
jgi:hypothetical protein